MIYCCFFVFYLSSSDGPLSLSLYLTPLCLSLVSPSRRAQPKSYRPLYHIHITSFPICQHCLPLLLQWFRVSTVPIVVTKKKKNCWSTRTQKQLNRVTWANKSITRLSSTFDHSHDKLPVINGLNWINKWNDDKSVLSPRHVNVIWTPQLSHKFHWFLRRFVQKQKSIVMMKSEIVAAAAAVAAASTHFFQLFSHRTIISNETTKSNDYLRYRVYSNEIQ